MTQQQLEREIARRTGESLGTVRRMGFSEQRPTLGRKMRLQARRLKRNPPIQSPR